MVKSFSSEEASKIRLKDGLAMTFAMPLERGAQNNALAADECIFCGCLQSEHGRLTDEHVVPDGLGWDLVILRATCMSCQRKINPFEQRAIKTWFGVQREIFGVQSKKSVRKKIASSNYIGALGSGTMPLTEIEARQMYEEGISEGGAKVAELLENGGIYPVFPLPPGALFGRDPYEKIPYSLISISKPVKMQEHSIIVRVNGSDFFRLVAKIAHCFAYIFSRSNHIRFVLNKFITDYDWTSSSYWIGSSDLTFDTNNAHILAVYTRSVPIKSAIGFFETTAVVVTVGLFTGFGAPAYDVVVGYLRK